MNIIGSVFILTFGICICEAGYYGVSGTQSEVEAPEYIPPYARNPTYNRGYGGYSGRKTEYSGTKTGYSGTKNGYSGTKNGYSSSKNGYWGTKSGFSDYSGTKNGYGYSRPWQPGPATNQEYRHFYNNANSPFSPKCEIECKNNGICVDTNTCRCPPNFDGKYCEFEKKPCLAYPPLPSNSKRRCSTDYCTITCAEGHKFIDGTTVADMRCTNGQWTPTRADLTSIPDCVPECDPPCLNGGVCLSVNLCQCPTDYRGPQCQYSASACDIRSLGFNGGYQCSGDADKFACKLKCPDGASFSAPAAEEYVCLYSTGVFLPQPIPQCTFEEVIVVTPSNPRNSAYILRSPSTMEVDQYEHSTRSSRKYGLENVKTPIIVVQDLTPKGGSCLTWAGLHYKTFDGKIYSFKTSCNQILVRDSVEHKYTVAVKTTQCERQGYCPYQITVFLDEKMYSLSTADDGAIVFRNSKRNIPIPAMLPGIRVSMPSDHVHVDLDFGITVKWDTNDVLLVEGSVLVWNKTEGLCGTLDGNPEDDMVTKEGVVAKTKSVLFDSWKLHEIEDMCGSNTTEISACNSRSDEDMKRAAQFCTQIFTKEKFRKCSKVMDVSQLLEACQWDYCACTTSLSPEECACRTVTVYAKECLRHGVEEMRSWRDPQTCPMKCREGKIYKSCGPATQPSCAFPELVARSNSSCVEGCFCPEGLLMLDNGRCVPKSECPCRIRNRTYPPGGTIRKSCNTCKCEAGEWVCTQVPCGARCGAVGDPHYNTFDGLRYDFMGHCTYTLLKTDNVTIDAENVACSGAISEAMNLSPYQGAGKPSCTKAVYVQYSGVSIHLKQGGFILVNGKEVTALPAMIRDVRIRAASSLFIMIQLPGKVTLWWDGNTRVFVDVPPAYHDKTQGLCGTFNLNQKDDFLTPEGDVEQSALAFANKWKTREFCDDVSTTEPEHPCKANIENKDFAEKYCSQLKGSLFESCHWYVDVQPYYEDCLYDMCACAGDVSRCLCPILGHYADSCAQAGVKIQWRYNVKECELHCTGGQEYTVCADSCLRTCTDVGLPIDDCKPSCVEGCACPVGQVLDNDNVCVAVSSCPCYHKGMEFKPGYKEVRAGKRERELCTCVGARWECQPATEDQIQNYPPAEDLRSNCSAANNMEFTTCELAQPLTCKNMHLPSIITSPECRPGCQCKKGYVMDVSSKKCVEPTACPCHHGGRSYPDGHSMQEGCNTCECSGGKWQCSSRPCAGVCSVWGDSHVTTFDGQTYDFEGVCSYLLAKGVMDGSNGFSVEIQNEPCGTTGATCSKSVTLRVSSEGSEETVSLTKNAPLPDTSKLKSIKLREAGAYVFLDVLSRGMSVQWDRGLRVYVRIDSMWADRVKGLCGNYNSDTRDDFQTPSGGGLSETSALLFADSWKLKPTCPKPQEVTDHCVERPNRKEWASTICGTMKRYPFSLCHSEVPPSEFVSRCEADACACDSGADCECACAALAAYAHACAARGVTFKWRSQGLCPMQCDEQCSNYHECMTPCPPETCDNYLNYPDIKAACEKETCVEGCKRNESKTCPPGTVYSNSSLSECVPRAKCVPPCMVLADGREVAEGGVVEEDRCHTCRCSGKQKICIGEPCLNDTVRNESKACPPGTVYSNSSLSECVPRAKCVPPCMVLADGREVAEGGVVEEDRCHTCRCSGKQKICIGEPCLNDTVRNESKACPPGTVYSNSSLSECVPRAKCVPPCMVLADGREVAEGGVVEEDRCHTCRCSGKQKICIGEPCLNDTVRNESKACPPGTVYSNSSLSECVPRAKCVPPCMVLADGREVAEGGVVEEDRCHTCRCSGKRKICIGEPCLNSTDSTTITPITTPHDTPMSCKTGWTEWISRKQPEIDSAGNSVELEPLSVLADFTIGRPMCDKNKMTNIVCRTVRDHLSPKQTGLNVECSLEKGLKCVEAEKTCPDFEIRVYCQCDEVFQCLDAAHPNHKHPTNCGQFYECTPDVLNPSKLHTVLKNCSEGLMYNPIAMVCDWPASVIPMRPECGYITPADSTTGQPESTPTSVIPPGETSKGTTGMTTTGTTARCRPGQVYKSCAFPCDKLCDHFKQSLQKENKCLLKQECIGGCVDESVANIKCDFGSMWRDHKTCVPIKDCTCYNDGQIVKPGGVVAEDCIKCQCLDNELHCDLSQCISTIKPNTGPPDSQVKVTETTPRATVTETVVTTHVSQLNATQSTRVTPTTYITTFAPIPTSPSTTPTTPGKWTETTVIIVTPSASPPPECSPSMYKDLLWGSEPLPKESFSASSSLSSMFQPQYAKLNGRPETNGGAWSPAEDDKKDPYIQVELPRKEPIYGVQMQGSPLFSEYVESYMIMYGDDGTVFSTVSHPDGQPKIFRGPVDNVQVMKQQIKPPIEAKFVRIKPISWHERISIRFELTGCDEFPTTTTETTVPTTTTETTVTTTETTVATTSVFTTPEPIQCTETLGLHGGLPLNMIEVSSNYDARPFLRLEGERGWRPLYSMPGEWILFNFTSPRTITALKTMGGVKGHVTAYNIMYTNDLRTFNPVLDSDGKPRLFAANFDSENVVMHEFRPPLHAQYLKVLPVKWQSNIEMKVEPLGCFEPYPTPEPEIPRAFPCQACPGFELSICSCAGNQYYNGDSCVPRDECPCLVGFIPYPVGSSYRSEPCDECLCKLGGVADCKPAKTCECEPDLVPTLKPSCECLCEPCKNGTKICPTSKICLPLEKWCDGLQDCPDDEMGCSTVAPVTETVTTTVVPTTAATKPTTAPAPTTVPPTTTTEKPLECPKVECPPGYFVRYTSSSRSRYSANTGTSDLPPPRPRNTYQRYQRGGSSKGGRGGYAKGGYSKTGYSKGGIYGPPSRPRQNEAFQLDRPKLNTTTTETKKVCPVFKCIPKLPPIPDKGSTPAPLVCSPPTCPPRYALKLESIPENANLCPQYVCVPPPERFDYCNMTGRTFTTFDGTEYKYDVCYHTLARETRSYAWIVFMRKKCLKDICQNQLIVLQDDQLILVKPNLMIDYNDYEYTVEQTSKICFQKNSFDVNRLGNGVFIKSRKYNFTVFYNADGDVKIGVSQKYMGHVDGLCGAYDGRPDNDRSLPSGRPARSTEQFGRAWAKPGLAPDACEVKAIPPEKQNRCWDVCKAITVEPIAQCARVLNLDKWRTICLENVCKCAQTVVNGTKRSEEECRCLLMEKLVAECMAADKDIDVASWRIQMNCPAECPPPLVHYDCYRKRCEPTCAPINSGDSACPVEEGECFPGCYCPEGTLRKGDQCVTPNDCLDCSCTGVGSPAKYVTFEGDDLPFLGNCTYLASRDTNVTGYHKYQVYATNGPCADKPSITCTKALHLIQEKNFINITKDANTKKLITTVNGVPVYKYPFSKDWVTVSLLNGQDVAVSLPELHVEVTVLQAKMQFTVQVPSQLYANRTEGLCGVCAGYQEHLITSNGTIAENFDEYGKSWQATPEVLNKLEVPLQEQCDEAPPRPECMRLPIELNPCYNINDVAKFGACHALVEPEPFIALCEDELCDSNSTDACPILERYAAECRKQGVCLDWRSDLCPYPCEQPLVYRPCIDCERTCDNHDELELNPKKCDKSPIEGCFCPQGKVRVNNTCIEPNKCFPCDAQKEHYAGDEWQEDACTKCTCSKLSNEHAAHVSCTTQTCTVPVCSELEDRLTQPAKPGACCPNYMCVLKPPNERCVEPKKMECGFGQVLKTKTKADGCKEFACECKPADECEPIPDESEVEMFKPGVERYVDRSGCCPKVELICVACPKPPACPQFQTLTTTNITGECCPEHKCELPKDKCVVNLEWEAAAKGGEKPRSAPEVMLKDMDAVWLDGPCRSCRCVTSLAGPAAQCSVTECPPVLSTEQFVVEPRPVPFACCPAPAQVACRDGDNIYKVGENWTSPYNVCESYKCAELEDGKLEKVTTVQQCDTDCQPGWEYSPATPESKQCCGKCKPVACVVDGVERKVGQSWSSPDFCTNYTCKDLNGTLQVQSVNESCPEISDALKKQYVLSKEKIPGKCCLKEEPIACRVGNKIYQEGQTWPSSNPCKNFTCARDVTGRLSHEASVESCVRECSKEQRYVEPAAGACCGHCVQDKCVVGDQLRRLGESWQSPDNCTSYSCDGTIGQVYLTSAPELCPDVSACAPEDLVNQTCCQVCKQKPSDLSKCVPTPIPLNETVHLVSIAWGPHGVCVNEEPIEGFSECRGSCDSSTLYSKEAGRHESLCECCQATHFTAMTVTLSCEDGSRTPHRIASPDRCACRRCGEGEAWNPASTPYPQIDVRSGEAKLTKHIKY